MGSLPGEVPTELQIQGQELSGFCKKEGAYVPLSLILPECLVLARSILQL